MAPTPRGQALPEQGGERGRQPGLLASPATSPRQQWLQLQRLRTRTCGGRQEWPLCSAAAVSIGSLQRPQRNAGWPLFSQSPMLTHRESSGSLPRAEQRQLSHAAAGHAPPIRRNQPLSLRRLSLRACALSSPADAGGRRCCGSQPRRQTRGEPATTPGTLAGPPPLLLLLLARR